MGSYTYAKDTVVSVAKSKAEIEDLVTRYGASAFASGTMDRAGRTVAVITFVAHDRRVQFELHLPLKSEFATKKVTRAGSGYSYQQEKPRTEEEQLRAWEQACRSKWRALALVVKAKLEAVSSGITTFEAEFLAHIVIPGDGRTVGQRILPELKQAYLSGAKLPPLLGSGG